MNRVKIIFQKQLKLSGFLIVVFLLFCNSLSARQITKLSGKFFTMTFNEKTGLYSINHNSELLVNNARLELQTEDDILMSNDKKFSFSTTVEPFTDVLGSGQKMHILMKQTGLDITVLFKVYDKKKLLTINVDVLNTSQNDIPFQEIRPLVVDGNASGGLHISDKIKGTRLLTQGYSFVDSGKLLFLKDEHFKYSSNYNLAFFNPIASQNLAVGTLSFEQTETQLFVENNPQDKGNFKARGLGFKIACSANKEGLSVLRYTKTDNSTVWMTNGANIEADHWIPDDSTENYNKYLLKPGAKISTGPVAFVFDEDPNNTLEKWAGYVQKWNDIQLPRALPVGWCSWPEMYYDINEVKMLRLADFVVDENLPDFGFELIQIDEGFQRKYGDWDGNLYFPRGMKWLSKEIHKRGLKSGIWITPYAISINNDVALNHKDWLFREKETGNIRTFQYYLGIPVYGLDISVPGAQTWIKDYFTTMSSDWGYDFFKLDYILHTVVDGNQFDDKYLTKAEAYRKGLQLVRDGIGNDAYLLECGMLSAAGKCDSWRTNRDIEASWEALTMENGTAESIPKRYYMHGKLFNIDADHLVVREPLTIDQARVLATNVAMSGGQVLAGDELYTLPKHRLQIIKNVIPPYGKAARSVDLFEKSKPAISSLHVKTDYDDWWVISIVNWTDKPEEKSIDLKRAGLDEDKKYLANEFWEQDFIGDVQNSLTVNLKPTSVKVIALREMTNNPQIAGTDRHILQGAVELKDVVWNEQKQQLNAKLLGAREHTFSISVYIPDSFKLNEVTVDELKVTPVKVSQNLIRIPIVFGDKKSKTIIVTF